MNACIPFDLFGEMFCGSYYFIDLKRLSREV